MAVGIGVGYLVGLIEGLGFKPGSGLYMTVTVGTGLGLGMLTFVTT